ncbi:MAG: SH3 domain-containing protein [Thermomicrobiales bacterium]|nr:SH3 domain-containing protein [Thermomicrobiales bacterium]
MYTARKSQTIAAQMRTLALAGTLALASVLPMVATVYADTGESTPTASSEPALSSADAFDVDAAGGLVNITAVVVAPGTTAPLLAEPDPDAEVLKDVENGTTVLLLIDVKDSVTTENGDRYWPVDIDGTTGWMNGRSLMSPEDYAAYSAIVDDSTGTATTTATNGTPFDYTGDLANATAQVSANGDGLKMRAEPSADADVVVSLAEGTIVNLRIADVDTVYDSDGTRWWPVEYDGYEGWVSGNYLITPGTSDQSGTTPTTEYDGDYVYIAGDWAVIRTADEGRTNVYAEANTDAEVVGTAPHMALVEVIAQAPNGWYEVRWDTLQGYVPGDLLTAGTAPVRANGTAANPTPTPAAVSTATAEPVETDAMTAGDVAVIKSESDAGVNVRASASSDADVLGQLPDGTNVDIVSGPETDDDGNAWYEVSSDDLDGWVRADLLERKVSGTDTTVSDTGDTSTAGFIMPLQTYRFTQDYGCSNLGFYSYDPDWGCSVHDGVDLAATQGTPIYAVADGTVVVSGWCDCGLGYYVEIDHGNGVHTIYGHQMEQPMVSVGQQVTQGQQIGKVGSTGLSTGPHVHFMVRVDGVTVDPKDYLPPIQTSAS